MAYPRVEPQPSFPRLEERVADRWRERSTFFESIARDGPLILIDRGP